MGDILSFEGYKYKNKATPQQLDELIKYFEMLVALKLEMEINSLLKVKYLNEFESKIQHLVDQVIAEYFEREQATQDLIIGWIKNGNVRNLYEAVLGMFMTYEIITNKLKSFVDD